MRVGFDASPITATRTGVGNYCYYLLKHLLRLAKDDDIYAFSSGLRRIDLEDFPTVSKRRHIQLPTRVLYKIWDVVGAPGVDTLLGGADVFHATNYYLPPVRKARRAVTIHDLSFIVVPELCSPKIVGPFARGVGQYCREADAILVYSESTKHDIINHLEIPSEKITVAPMAVDEDFRPMAREEAERLVSEKHGIQTPFLLFVSTLEPRKNVVGLLRAFARIAPEIPHDLVLIGSVGWNTEEIFHTIQELNMEDRIRRPGYIPHMELPEFYCSADAFVFPTHYEGFGLPLLEALTCGCPVVTSDNSSVPEVTGDAAIRVASHDVEGFAEKVLEVIHDESLRKSLAEKGMRHAKAFSWEKCARSTYGVYESLAQ